MRIKPSCSSVKVAVVAALLPLAGCSIDVRDSRSGKRSDVDIRTPAGNLSVRTDVNGRDTGLAVYPGARAGRRRGHDNGNVNIDTAWFGVKVVAAEYESDDSPDRLLDFYKNEMSPYGTVVECRGEVDFRGRRGAKQPYCKEKPWSDNVQLVVGTEDHQRIVAVKPHASYTEFALVYVETRGN